MIHKEIANQSDNLANRYLLFPFTHITQNDLETILTFFPQFSCLSIDKDFQNSSILDELLEQKKVFPHFLPAKLLDLAEEKFEQYLEWIKTNQGNEHNLKLLLKENPYFTSDADVTAIKSQIKGAEKDKNRPRSCNFSLLNDLLFLKMAQLYDEQNEDIDLEFNNIDQISNKLVTSLRGLEDCDKATTNRRQSIYADSRGLMVQERISAWFRCINAIKITNHEDATVLFITTNEDVFDSFKANCKDVINTLDIDNIKVHENRCENRDVWQTQFASCLAAILKADGERKIEMPEVSDKCSITGQIKVCNFLGGDINHKFNVIDKHISVCLIKLK